MYQVPSATSHCTLKAHFDLLAPFQLMARPGGSSSFTISSTSTSIASLASSRLDAARKGDLSNVAAAMARIWFHTCNSLPSALFSKSANARAAIGEPPPQHHGGSHLAVSIREIPHGRPASRAQYQKPSRTEPTCTSSSRHAVSADLIQLASR